MPRKRSRFSDLENMYRRSGGVAAPGTPLAGYIDFKTGKTKIARRKTTVLTPAERRRYGISLLPFNIDAPATPTQDDRYISTITGFSRAGLVALGLNPDTDLGYGKQTVAGATAQTEGSYYPALLRPVVRLATTPNPEISSITKIKYNYYTSNSYGIPFGRRTASAAGDSEQERRAALTTAVRTGATQVASAVGYEPEVWRGQRSPLAELP